MIDNLYKKFKQTATITISRSRFYKSKTFLITVHKVSDRNTCMCKIHSNMKFLLNQLKSLWLFDISSTASSVSSRVCDVSSKDCAYGKCTKCAKKTIQVVENDNSTSYFKWIRKSESRKGAKDKIYDVTFFTKEKIPCTVKELITAANLEISEFIRHVYNTGHQHKTHEFIRENLDENSAYIIMDFSENYVFKYAEEVQAVHFGASKKQVSLHTGAIYFKNQSLESISCVSFCTVSECLNHDSSSI